jgi:endo-1,4-beta-xylanase
VAGCVGVTVWSFTDKYSWIPETFPGQGDALIYDANFNKKAAWTSISSVLAAKATGVPPSSTTTLVTVTTTKATSTSSTKTTSTAPSTTSSASGAEQTRWGQCGGNYWTGPTKCQSPWTCQKQNDWYSQCL